jgi:hypothetical protein
LVLLLSGIAGEAAMPRLSAGEPVLRVAEPSFTNDVMAVLSKAGCNAGTCHGNRNGKGGFKLSLRGQDPDLDLAALTREAGGRRTDRIDPGRSLILRKPTLQVPHEGGLRFGLDSEEHAILLAWVAAGAQPDPPSTPRLERIEVTPRDEALVEPADSIQIRVLARFSDGTERDVTRFAVYEASSPIARISSGGLVERQGMGEATVIARFLHCQEPVRLAFVPARPGFAWSDPPATNYIDEHIFRKLRRLRRNPSDLAGDTVFLRRAFLDLLGCLPSAEEARAFAVDARPDKRARIVDDLLERPEFADFWALKWSDILRNEEKALDRKGVNAFHDWIRLGIARGKPLDQFAREVVAARGSTYKDPATNFYRANREVFARSEAVAQVFLGTRLQCAKCHNHPFDRWTQDDYHAWAALFAGVSYKVLVNLRTDTNDQHEFKGEQVVWTDPKGQVTNPRTGRAAAPRFLGSSETPPAGAGRLEALAAWLASPGNDRFARAQANRIWFHLMGRGIVEPNDDFRATNPPSHPALLDALAEDLIEGGFDLRRLIRRIMASRAYQLSSSPNETNEDDAENYSHAVVRRLSAEQILDCQSQVAGVPARFNGYPEGTRASQLPGTLTSGRRSQPTAAEGFLKTFGRPERLLTCECERSTSTTMGQAFQLISGQVLHAALTDPGNRIGVLLASGKPLPAMVDELYWTALSRPPSAEEAEESAMLVGGSADRRAALEDVLWGLLNAKELLLRQ